MGRKRKTTEQFITEAREVHGNKYCYDKVNYEGTHIKVLIVCPEHGEFSQAPNNHLNGQCCPLCANELKTKSSEQFIAEAKAIHGNKYCYDSVEYKTNKKKVQIICPEHGVFLQTPNEHLTGQGCVSCEIESRTKKQEQFFIAESKRIHDNKYSYDKVQYVNRTTKVQITCPEHGDFLQTPSDHLRGKGCLKCSGKAKSNTSEFIKRAKEVHGNKFCYDKVQYVNATTKVTIICPVHGEFLQTPTLHLSSSCGCSQCAKNTKSNTDEFVTKAKRVHGDTYGYDSTDYVNSTKLVLIYCKVHKRNFLQSPSAHLSGNGCPYCANKKMRLQRQRYQVEKVERLKRKYGDNYVQKNNIK